MGVVGYSGLESQTQYALKPNVVASHSLVGIASPAHVLANIAFAASRSGVEWKVINLVNC
ncbi:hypothetical protein OIPHN330_19650 [Citrobacter freundii]|nr:hypothetical protein OIPHN330_19650 [Citrobacter freundii]BEJ39243.1 hypothetical protein OIPHN354_19550 [Citrobacter freundii]